MSPPRRGLLLLICLLVPAQSLLAEEVEGLERVAFKPMVALIIDDLGDRLFDGLRAINLPGEVTYSILPQTTYSRRLAEQAHRQGKQVMLHQPMQAISDAPMGPGGLSLHMTHEEFLRTLRANLASVPYVRGVNNHMGSLLTRHPGPMGWLMDELQARGDIFFVDSTTTSKTVAQRVALEHKLPTMRRNVFLDHENNQVAIRQQFDRFISQAKAVGSSLAIAHPYPETLMVLEQELPRLRELGVRLLPVSEFIAQRSEQRERLWQASLSPLQKDLKSSKQ